MSEDAEASPPMTLLFRSPERIPVDSGVQKVLRGAAVHGAEKERKQKEKVRSMCNQDT